MKKFYVCLVILVGLSLLVACGGSSGPATQSSGSNSTVGGTQTATSVAGSWDIAPVSTVAGNQATIIEVILAQDSSGNITGNGTVTATGPAGNLWFGEVSPTLAAATAVGFDVTGNEGCIGTGNGLSTITGTISGTTVNLTINDGGTSYTFKGTYNSTSTPPLSGTYSGGTGACADQGTITGVFATALTGTYSSTAAGVSITLAEDAKGNLATCNVATTGSGSPGNGTCTGSVVGNAFTANVTFPSDTSSNGVVYGYYDTALKSVLLSDFKALGQSSCQSASTPTVDGGWCPIGVLAKQ
jgi:hypothetical protein